jgi:DNA-binding response OmpR family regulator
MLHRSIFVTDDDQPYVDLVTALLIKAGYPNIVGYVGDDAFLRICDAHPDLVLLGVNPPHTVRDWTTLHALRRHLATHHIPIILCSATLSLVEAMADALRRSNCHTLEKPFTHRALLEKVAAAFNTSPVDSDNRMRAVAE